MINGACARSMHPRVRAQRGMAAVPGGAARILRVEVPDTFRHQGGRHARMLGEVAIERGHLHRAGCRRSGNRASCAVRWCPPAPLQPLDRLFPHGAGPSVAFGAPRTHRPNVGDSPRPPCRLAVPREPQARLQEVRHGERTAGNRVARPDPAPPLRSIRRTEAAASSGDRPLIFDSMSNRKWAGPQPGTGTPEAARSQVPRSTGRLLERNKFQGIQSPCQEPKGISSCPHASSSDGSAW